MASNSATQLATQQSIKAYVDSQVGANNELSEILANGNTTGGTNIVFGDSASVSDDRLVFGAGSDLQIYHSGTHSYIDDAGTGNLTLRGNASVRVEKYEGEILADFAADGAVSLYHDNSVKIATTSTGVSVTGNVAVSGTVDGRDVATDGTKLDTVETNADVTDTANVTAAGALMDSELTSEASVKALNQGVATTDSPTFAGVTVNGNVEFDGLSGTGSVTVTDILDQDDMSGNSATALATQQSIKAYVDSQVATVDTLAEVLGNGNTTGGTDIAVGTGDDITFADSSKAIFGAGSDLQIFHDPSGPSSLISDQGAGDLILRGSNQIRFQDATGAEHYAIFNENGAVQLYYDNAVKLATTSTGIDVTGTVTADGLTVDGAATINSSITTTDVNITSNTPVIRFTESDQSDKQYQLGSFGSAFAIYDSNNSQYRYVLDTNGNHVFNEGSTDSDFRVESNGNTHMLFVDAGNDRIGIGTSSPSTILHAYNNATSAEFRIQNNDGTGHFQKYQDDLFIDNKDTGDIVVRNGTSQTERMRIDSGGNVGIGVTPQNSSGTWRNFEQSGMNLAGRSAGGVDGMIGTNYVFKTDNSEVYKYTAGTSRLFFDANEIKFQQAASGTAGTAISWSEAMRIDSNGDIYFFDNGGASLYYDASAGLTINEAGDDRDFRVESDGNANMFFVDGGNNAVAFGTANTGSAQHTIRLDGTDIAGSTDGATVTKNAILNLANFNGGTTNNTVMLLGSTSASTIGQIASGIGFTRENGVNWGTQLRFYIHPTATTDLDALDEVARFTTSEFAVNEQSMDYDFRVESNSNANMLFLDAGNERLHVNGTTGTATFNVAGSSSFANTATSGALVASGATLSIQGTGTYNSNYFGTDRATVAIRSNEPSNDGWNPTINIATVRQSLGTNQNATGGIGFTTIDDSNNTGIDDAARIQVINTNGANNTSATGLVFYNNVGGSKTQASRAVFKLAPYEAIFNEDSHDIDFRVESNNNANMLFVDGGSDRVGIGRDPTDNDSTLQISADATSSTGLQLQCRGATNENKKLVLGYDTTSDIASITAFEAGVTHRPLHLQGSTFVWNEDGSDHDFRVESDSNAYGFFLDAGKKSVGVNFDASVSSYAQFGIRFSGSDTNVNSTGVAIQDSGTNSNVSFCTFFNSGGAGIGSITRVGTTNAVAFNTTSDRRAKENIADADDAGAVIDAIQVRKFDWIEGSQHQPYGMIAQELVEHAPEVVHQPADEEDMMGVDYSKLVPMLVKEIQSLRARVAQLESN